MYGMAGFLGLGKETSWGSGVAATDFIELMSENITLDIARYDTRNVIGRLSEPDDSAGIKTVQGDALFAAFPIGLGYVLRSAFGVVSGSIIVSGQLYRNDFSFGDTAFSNDCPVPPYTFEIFRDVTSSQRYTGVAVSRLQLACQPNQDVRVTASILARATAELAKSTPSFPGSSIYPFAFDTASISIGGAASAKLEAYTFTADNQLVGVPRLNNSSEIAVLRRNGFQQVRFGGTIAFEDLTEYKNFKDQTEQAIKIHHTLAASFGLTIDMPRFVYTAFPLGTPGRERLTVAFEGIGRYHTGSLNAVKVSLFNTKSDY